MTGPEWGALGAAAFVMLLAVVFAQMLVDQVLSRLRDRRDPDAAARRMLDGRWWR